MNEREELEKQLKAELQWVKYRMSMLDIIEVKLVEIRGLEEILIAFDKCNLEEVKVISAEIKKLGEQIKAIDSESKTMGDCKILE